MSTVLVHIGVRATDLGKTIRFWRDGLGLPVVSTHGSCYDLSDGHHNFRVFQHNGPDRPAHVSGMLDYLHTSACGCPTSQRLAAAYWTWAMKFFPMVLGGKEPVDVHNISEGAFKVEDPDGITVDVTASDDQWPGAVLK